MNFSLKTANNWHQLSCDCLIIPLIDDKKLSAKLKDLDIQQQGRISALLKSGDIKASNDSITLIHSGDNKGPRLLFLGLGKKPSFANLRQALSQILAQLKKAELKSAALLLDGLSIDGISEQQLIQQSAELLLASSYQYDATLSKKASSLSLKKVTLLCSSTSAANKAALLQGQATGIGINRAKHLGNLPANFCTPSYIAEQAQSLAKEQSTLTCKVLNEAQMKKLNMHSLLSVTAGTDEPAKFIILQYSGAKKASDKPYVLVGKGVTFDSGGISIKPGVGMDEMKYDMCGAASVFGTMEAIANLKAPINVIGVIAAVENMPSGRATKPGDVITSMAGKTIEVLNTDAEGRLVLCDALTYVERFKPKAVIDIATLTGAAIVALGKHATALYSNRPELSQSLVSAGEKTYDRAWPMPLWEEYNQQLSSNFADIANIGGPQGGSVTAACFLSRFTEAYPWAHLDIAGPAWLSGTQKGATGRPVSLLVQYLLDQC